MTQTIEGESNNCNRHLGGHLAHGYAMAIAKSQGATVDITHTLATGNLDNRTAYTTLSRGRHANHLHTAVHVLDIETHAPAIATQSDQLAHALHRDPTKGLAIDSTPAAADPVDRTLRHGRALGLGR